jgi:hypothetical protein
MTQCRICGVMDNDLGELVICEDCADKKENTKPNYMGELVEGYEDSLWKVYRQDAGMGEKDYAVFHNGIFFCRTEHLITAQEIIRAVGYKAKHLSEFKRASELR